MQESLSVSLKSLPRRKGLTRSQRRTVAFYGFIAPWLITFILLGVIPLVLGILTSLTDYDGLNLGTTMKFLGLKNYIRAFNDKDAAFSLGRTLLWGLANLPTWLTLSFLLAVILNQDVKGRSVFRTLYYLPSIIPAVAAISAWRILLDRNFGLLNAFISLFRPGTAIGWLSDYALAGMTMIAVWGGLGGGMLIFLAGLQDIPEELIEAAKIDGANAVQIFLHITWPLMTPVVFFQLILALIGSFQQLTLPLIVTQIAAGQTSVPPRSIYLFMIHVWRQIMNNQRYGYGTALLWLLFIGVVALTALVFWSAKFWVYTASAEQEGAKS